MPTVTIDFDSYKSSQDRITELEAALRFTHKHAVACLKANRPREGTTAEPTKAELAAEFISAELDAIINTARVAVPDLCEQTP